MSTKAINYKIILRRDGQTQQQRMPQWLNPSLVPADARTKQDFFNYIKGIAKEINFYDLDTINNTIIINGTWEDFFNLQQDELTALAELASLPPHIALWNAFIELYQKPGQLINTLTQRHLDFYYNDVLGLKKNDPLPDKAHVLFELKKNTADTLLTAGTSLLAGKDSAKKDLHYELTHDIVVNKSKVEQLKSLYVNPKNKNFVHYAPIANSSDGLGAELDKANPKWNAFGNPGLPLAQIGFCLAADVLKMKEGDRTVTVKLTLKDLPATAKSNAFTTNLFNVSITGEKGWIGPKTVSPKITSGDNENFDASFSFNITKDEPSVIAYDQALHGSNLSTLHPVLQILINNAKADFGYNDLASAELVDATIAAEVKGIKDLALENDFGKLDAKKPFTPFGSSPERNVNFSIGNTEAFSKRLREFSLDVEWKNIPAPKLDVYFSDYGSGNSNSQFTATAAFKDAFNWEEKSNIVQLFDANNAQLGTTWKFTNPTFPSKFPVLFFPQINVAQYKYAGEPLQQKLSSKMSYLMPAFAPLQAKSISSIKTNYLLYQPFFTAMVNAYKEIRSGMINLRLRKDFMFKEYREKYTAEILRYSKDGGTLSLPEEPFAPEIQSISLNYIATTAKVSFSGTSLNDYVDEEIELFHFGAFGPMREHAYARNQYEFLNNNLVKLLPEYIYESEFYIGFGGLKGEDAACVLFQTAEGSANPNKAKVNLKWSMLCDNYWKDLTNEDFIFDTTNSFLTSGVIKFVIPREATTVNTIMPDGLLWLKAVIAQDSDAVCSLVDVQSNAAIAVFNNQDNDASHFASSLAANTINKLEIEQGAIKSIKQPYASFGGRIQENDNSFYTRISERLRHKERSIALWDYERMILQHFPKVHKVKCINHASANSYYQPGSVLIIVVPDLTNQNAVNMLQPRVDKNTLDEIYTFLTKHTSSWAEVSVSNPFYEAVKISVRIKLKTGYEFNYYQKLINQQLQQFLSPWIKNAGSEIYFGGKITESTIVKFLEGLEYVDFITDLYLFHSINNGKSFKNNVKVAESSSPASILVSHDHHEILNY